jgi:two-component system, LytTR family, sensor kinase
MLLINTINFLYSVYIVPFFPDGYNDKTAFTINEFFTLLIFGVGVNFLLFSAFLYFMEVAEGLHTTQLIHTTSTQLSETEKHLSSLQIAPNSMMQSIDQISAMLSTKNQLAPMAILNFSDLLRYKLYKTNTMQVLLSEEVMQLQNLFSFYANAYQAAASLDVQADDSVGQTQALQLIGLIEPFLETYQADCHWHCHAIVFVQNKELTIDVAIASTHKDFDNQIKNIKFNLESESVNQISITMDKTDHQYSIQICQQLQN